MQHYEDRLIDLESQLAFQDDLIEQLNQQLSKQQLDLNLMQRQLNLLVGYVKDLKAASFNPDQQPSLQDERPPHY